MPYPTRLHGHDIFFFLCERKEKSLVNQKERKRDINVTMQHPGFEPGSDALEAPILTIRRILLM